jgi:hypothetical protein
MQIPRLPAYFYSFDEVKDRVVEHFQSNVAQRLAVAKEHVIQRIDVLLDLREPHLAGIDFVSPFVDAVEGFLQTPLLLPSSHHLVEIVALRVIFVAHYNN